MVIDKIVVGDVPLLCSCDIIIFIVKDHIILDCMGVRDYTVQPIYSCN